MAERNKYNDELISLSIIYFEISFCHTKHRGRIPGSATKHISDKTYPTKPLTTKPHVDKNPRTTKPAQQFDFFDCLLTDFAIELINCDNKILKIFVHAGGKFCVM